MVGDLWEQGVGVSNPPPKDRRINLAPTSDTNLLDCCKILTVSEM